MFLFLKIQIFVPAFLLRHVLVSIIVPITLPKDCRRSAPRKGIANARKPFRWPYGQRKPFCKQHYIAIYECCQLFFSFFFFFNLGKITVISLAHTRDLPGFTTKLCGFPLIYRYLLGCNFHSRHSEPATSDKNPMKNFVI